MEKMQNTSPPAREAGFTLLEVIVAIAILTVGLLAVGAMQTSAIGGNLSAYRTSEAVTLAQDRMERLLFTPYADALLNVGTGKADPSPPAPRNFTVTYDVQNVAGINAKLITVNVKVSEKRVTRVIKLNCLKPETL
jgi:prepilin-type N-terminal cleavage/methylation domain-containing protein